MLRQCCISRGIEGFTRGEYMARSKLVMLLSVLCAAPIWPVHGSTEPVTVPVERETLVIPAGLDGWELAWHANLVNVHNMEWVTGGETVDNWSQLFTVSRMLMDPDVSTSKFAGWSLEMLSHGCPEMLSSIIEKSKEDTTYEWSVVDCKETDDQHELVRLIRSGDYLFRIAYTRKGPAMPSDVREHWLSVVGAIERLHCCEADDKGLSMIPLLQLYASFDFNKTPGMKVQFKEEADKNTRATAGAPEYSGFPQDHTYDIFLISLSPTQSFHARRMAAGVVADADGALRCPARHEDEGPAATGEEKEFDFCSVLPAGAALSGFPVWHGVGFQPGLPIAFAVRSTDGAHAAYGTLIPRPIRGINGPCAVELELASTDGRTYVAHGSGFAPGQTVLLDLRYAQNEQSQTVQVDSAGNFIAALNHPGQAAGRKKWEARLDARAAMCNVTVKYKWGEAGMKP